MNKKWWKSKSLWLGVIIVLGGVAEYLVALPPGVAMPTIIAGILTIVVRFLTKESIGK